MTAEGRLRHITLKIARAKEHEADLNSRLKDFLTGQPYSVGVRREQESGRPVYFVESAVSVPDTIPLVAGDAIQNLMSALDHLAYQLVCRATNDAPPRPGRIYFPIADDAQTYDSQKRGKMQGANEAVLQALDDIKPYKGGNDLLWQLHRLNNIEKHRLLFTVGAQAAGIHLGHILAMNVGDQFSEETVEALKAMNLFLNPADKGFPLVPGFELYRGAPGEATNTALKFQFQVVLNEPEISEGAPVSTVVRSIGNEVERVVNLLTPFLL